MLLLINAIARIALCSHRRHRNLGRRNIAIRTIENDPETRYVSVGLRSCRFRDESYLDVHQFYSFSACSVQCRKRQQLKVCNCTSHLMPNTGEERGGG